MKLHIFGGRPNTIAVTSRMILTLSLEP